MKIPVEIIHEDDIEFRAETTEVETVEKTTRDKPKPKKAKQKRIKKRKIIAFTFIFLLTFVLVFGNQVGVTEEDGNTSWFMELPIIRQIKHLAESADRDLKGEKMDRINILLLGMGGIRHEGGYLTDTIMIVSIEPSSKKVAMISVPRDLAIPVEDMGLQKINAINAYAEMAEADTGGMAISQAVSDVLKIPIDYYIRVDFEGFINIVDELGGLDVMVENTLDDYQYPIMGNEEADWEERFMHLHVDAGLQHMDGTLALQFARSRHGINGEGSDFARARRQQLVIMAAKDKALKLSNIFKPLMIKDILDEFNAHISTNLKTWEIVKFYDLAKEFSQDYISNKVLDASEGGLLVEGRMENGAYILTPRSGDFAEIQYLVNNIFSEAPVESKTTVTKERSTIEVRNGTWINGLASQTAVDIEKYGFLVVRVGNSSRQNFQKDVIYDLTNGEKNESLTILKDKTGANVAYSLPDWLIDDIQTENEIDPNPIQPDFILIVGQDADETDSGEENLE